MERGSRSRMAAISAACESAANTRCPGQHLVEQLRRRRRDPRGASVSSPRSCSGDMYGSVPKTIPALVSGMSLDVAANPSGLWQPELRQAEVEQLDA